MTKVQLKKKNSCFFQRTDEYFFHLKVELVFVLDPGELYLQVKALC